MPQSAETGACGRSLNELAAALRAVQDYLGALPEQLQEFDPDPAQAAPAFAAFGASLALNPWRLWSAQLGLANDFAALGRYAWWRWLGVATDEVEPSAPADRRFRDPDWKDRPLFDALRQAYLSIVRRTEELLGQAHELDEHEQEKLRFVSGQVLDAVAPSNFLLSNPRALRRAVETGGRSVLAGLANLAGDLERSGGRFDVSTTPEQAFELGRDLAATPGKVVFENDLLQLIQYAPTTPEVARRPLLVLPPWMNKYYILDLRPENSFLRWVVEQGQTVFVVSWVNPDADLAGKGFDDYLREGALAAIDAVLRATGEPDLNVVGYCLGGILLSATLAVLAARGDRRVASATLLATMVDFTDAGDVQLFIDEQGLESLERRIERQGFLDGASVNATFRALRANDLVWSFYVNNYLLGEQPRPFDLLHWNADSTNMPAACHGYVMRNFYLRNLLREPGALTLDGTPIDVTAVETPSFIFGAAEDHIAPWKTAYRTTQLFRGPRRFVLGASGHVAGVVNPPAGGKYGYWVGEELPADPQRWRVGARERPGSWWPEWMSWLAGHSGGTVPARVPGAGGLPAIEDAPGRYVRRRLQP